MKAAYSLRPRDTVSIASATAPIAKGVMRWKYISPACPQTYSGCFHCHCVRLLWHHSAPKSQLILMLTESALVPVIITRCAERASRTEMQKALCMLCWGCLMLAFPLGVPCVQVCDNGRPAIWYASQGCCSRPCIHVRSISSCRSKACSACGLPSCLSLCRSPGSKDLSRLPASGWGGYTADHAAHRYPMGSAGTHTHRHTQKGVTGSEIAPACFSSSAEAPAALERPLMMKNTISGVQYMAP